MKRVALIVSLLCCVLSASAQNAKGWSLIPYAKVASSIDFLYGPYESKFHGDLGVDAKYDFNEHWSLLGGIDYQYRRTNSDKLENWEDGVPGTGFNNYFRLPIRVEFSYKWFYVNAMSNVLSILGLMRGPTSFSVSVACRKSEVESN